MHFNSCKTYGANKGNIVSLTVDKRWDKSLADRG